MRSAGKTAIGLYLKSLRDTRSLSLREIERKTGVSNAVLSQIESGQVKRPSPETLYKLAELYGVPYDELMARAGYPSPQKSAADSRSPQAVLIRLGLITEDEEGELLDYLVFIRSRARQGRNKNQEGLS